MKNFSVLIFFLMLPSLGLFAQNYSDGIDDLLKLKSVSEDLAQAIRLEWDHNSPEYREANRLYNQTKNSVDNMVKAFEIKIKLGEKITESDVQRYINEATENSSALSAYYKSHAPAGGTHALFGIDDIVFWAGKLFNFTVGIINKSQAMKIEHRLADMHTALDPCCLRDWDSI